MLFIAVGKRLINVDLIVTAKLVLEIVAKKDAQFDTCYWRGPRLFTYKKRDDDETDHPVEVAWPYIRSYPEPLDPKPGALRLVLVLVMPTEEIMVSQPSEMVRVCKFLKSPWLVDEMTKYEERCEQMRLLAIRNKPKKKPAEKV